MADTKASDETAASALDPATDGVAIVQSGADRFAVFSLFLDMVLAYLIDADPTLAATSDDIAPSKSAVVSYVANYFTPVQTESGSNRDFAATDVGIYWRFDNASPKTATFQDDATEPLPDNVEFHIRCVDADLTLTPDTTDVTLNPPFGGTLVLSDGMTVTVKRVAVDEFDVIGQTVPV